jgi:proton-coupled amino acid transporter
MDALSHSGVSCNISTGLRSCLHDFCCAESPSKSRGLMSIHSLTNRPSLQGFVSGITNCATLIPVKYFILVQLIVFLPLALVRDLAKLSSTALIADGFILVGLIYIFGSEFEVIAQRGIADVKLFNPKDFALFVG